MVLLLSTGGSDHYEYGDYQTGYADVHHQEGFLAGTLPFLCYNPQDIGDNYGTGQE